MFKQASGLKEEMLDRYSGDGYYFLEDYIDGMMEMSKVLVKDLQLSTRFAQYYAVYRNAQEHA
jgi:hypothetical protein